jgi:hypothetical protein
LIESRRIADQICPDLHERPEVFAERLRLLQEVCFVLVRNKQVMGYGHSRPWFSTIFHRSISSWGAFLKSPECLLVHDMAVLPQARRRGAVTKLIEITASLSRKLGIACPRAGFGLQHPPTMDAARI